MYIMNERKWFNALSKDISIGPPNKIGICKSTKRPVRPSSTSSPQCSGIKDSRAWKDREPVRSCMFKWSPGMHINHVDFIVFSTFFFIFFDHFHFWWIVFDDICYTPASALGIVPTQFICALRAGRRAS